MSKRAFNTKICSRCHTSTHVDFFDEDETICKSCLEIKPRIAKKGEKGDKKSYQAEPEEWKYCCTFGDAGLYL